MTWVTRTVAAGLALRLLSHDCAVEAAEIKILAALGVKEIVEDLGPKFERATGHKLAIAFANLGTIMNRVKAGESADVIILPAQGIESLVKQGQASPGNVTAIARGGLGVAVRKGVAKPDISSPDALKQALLAAKSITYLDPAGGGVSGTHFVKVLDRLGIAADMKSRTILHRNSAEAAALIADGKAEIGVNLIQELMPKAGIDFVGPLPGDLQYSIVYPAAVMTDAKDAVASKALIDFMRTPEAAAAIRSKGMDPG